MTFDFDYWRAQYALEAFRALDEKWSAVIHGTDDEDIQSDYSMDLVKLDMLRDSFERDAVEAFGKRVANFSRKLLVDMTTQEVLKVSKDCGNEHHS